MDITPRLNGVEQRQVVAHSILLFFAMSKEEQDDYLPEIDRRVEYVWDGDTGDKTEYPAYYFSMRSMDYLAVYPPRCGRTIGDMIDEMSGLLSVMASLSPERLPPDEPVDAKPGPGTPWQPCLWLSGPPYSAQRQPWDILFWSFLRRYARLILADPSWKFDYPLLLFEEISKHFTVYT